MTEITVIIPAYNAGLYICECLQSIYDQTFKNIDVLVINDSSTDNTAKIVQDFAEQHKDLDMKLITVPNGGAARARNTGIKKAKGRYIAFIDADDTVDKTMFQKMLKAAKKMDADLVTCDFYWTHPNKKKRETLFAAKNNSDLFYFAWVGPWNKLYRRTMVIDHEIFFTEGYTYEDISFYLKCIPYCKTIRHIAEPFINWRQHSTSTMRENQNKRIPQIFPVLQDAINFYKANNKYKEYEIELEFFCTKLLWGSSMYRVCQVRDRHERKKYILMTISWLKKYFPNWKKNPRFQFGLRWIYIQSINVVTADIYANLIYFIRYYGRRKM